MTILMCRPDFFEVSYEINPWMSLERQSDHPLAVKQWNRLYSVLSSLTEVKLVEPQAGLPDMVFTANAGFVRGKEVYLAHFRHAERQGEREHFQNWFLENGYHVVDDGLSSSETKEKTRVFFEGAGDLLAAGNYVFAAHGFRSDPCVYESISQWLSDLKLIQVELVNPYFYHLDTCFCPLADDLALVVPSAFSPESLSRIRSVIDTIEVCESDAKRFAANAVVVENTIVLPLGCDTTEAQLKNRGFDVIQVAMTEFLKSGGAAKCLTLAI